jgi:hypothetical protein
VVQGSLVHGVDAALALRTNAGCSVRQLFVACNLRAFLPSNANERITTRCSGGEV